MDENLLESDKDKIRISSQFLLQSPPGEFNEVFNDIRALLNNDTFLEKGCANAIAEYNKNQFVPVKIEGAEAPTLITKFNELKDGYFLDPKSKKMFKYDHLRKDATDVSTANIQDVNENSELWRKTLQNEVDDYINEHYDRTGVSTVFVTTESLVLCIESHQFQPKNFWNGRWRSEWHIPFFNGKSSDFECHGKIRLQVHYYEDGNVQLISHKDIKVELKFTQDIVATAKEIIRVICENENSYQYGIHENYAAMFDTTFKVLRRPLPITRSKIDWTKLSSYRIIQDIKPQ